MIYMAQLLADVAGWAGALALLLAYGMVSFKKLPADSGWYQFLNAVGSACLIVNTVYHRAYPSAAVNVVWIVIATVAQIRARTSSPRERLTTHVD
jgi:hypothetical protein